MSWHLQTGRLLLLLTALPLSTAAFATTPCHSDFTFIAAVAGNDKEIWIGQRSGLEQFDQCSGLDLHQIAVRDSDVVALTSALSLNTWEPGPKRDAAWEWLLSAREHVRTAAVDSMRESSGIWADSSGALRISAPPRDSLLGAKMSHDYIDEGQEWRAWCAAQGGRCCQLPSCDGGSLRLLYAYPWGLYFDYRIAGAYYVPRWHVLCVLTETGAQVCYETTMNWFFVFKVDSIESEN